MTRERAKQLLNDPAFKAWAEGRAVQCDCANDWFDISDGTTFDNPSNTHRMKPEPKLRPWRPEEVPLPCVLRCIGDNSIRWVALRVSFVGVVVSSEGAVQSQPFDDLLECSEHSTDGCKTWLPCGVMEDAQ